jgi:hypothetical protein
VQNPLEGANGTCCTYSRHRGMWNYCAVWDNMAIGPKSERCLCPGCSVVVVAMLWRAIATGVGSENRTRRISNGYDISNCYCRFRDSNGMLGGRIKDRLSVTIGEEGRNVCAETNTRQGVRSSCWRVGQRSTARQFLSLSLSWLFAYLYRIG